MKEEGVKDTDPEYLKVRQMLSAVQQHNAYRNAQRQQFERLARQREAQKQQVLANGQHAVNGVNGKIASLTIHLMS